MRHTPTIDPAQPLPDIGSGTHRGTERDSDDGRAGHGHAQLAETL